MVEPEHIAAAVMARFNATPARVVCVGGLWYGKVREQAGTPYALLNVTAEEPKRLSDRRYHRAFVVRISAWGDDGAAKTAGGAIAARELEAMMPGLAVPEAVKVVDVKPTTSDLAVEETPRNAADVCLSTREWRVLIEGN